MRTSIRDPQFSTDSRSRSPPSAVARAAGGEIDRPGAGPGVVQIPGAQRGQQCFQIRDVSVRQLGGHPEPFARHRPGFLQILVRFRGKSIADVLNMPIEEATDFYEAPPAISRHLSTLKEVGLGYIRLGQPATTCTGRRVTRMAARACRGGGAAPG
ncbi:hypothetical protein E5083_07450 [Streptomyces bauhiniae]|uniref:Uncharacterized protein n=1 Tax=Streptomyces bauhiniae TaxID=2340725 RepID=A0A4Z1D9U3_9ACTN|nr:hypothetical protein E5083_07450 [Streptomyces bauhiniae]